MKNTFCEKKGLLMQSNNVNKQVLVERRECYIFVEKYLQRVCNSMDQTRV